MSQDEVVLSDFERDALTELVNIGVSRAAAALRKLAGKQVLLSVPSVEMLDYVAAAALVREREDDLLVAVRQDFSGAICGRALLIFPQSSSLELVRAVANTAMTDDEADMLEDEALAETGNIVLNGCLGTMANMLRRPLAMTLPEVIRGDGTQLFQLDRQSGGDDLVLFLYINFLVKQRNIRGYIAMLLDLPSHTALRQLVREFIASVMGDQAGADQAGDNQAGDNATSQGAVAPEPDRP